MSSDDEQKAIEEAFLQSWDAVERFFRDPNTLKRWEYLKSVGVLIAELRKRGYDRKLRAGQSMYTLMLSHSHEWGLRSEQEYIAFEVTTSGGMKISYRKGFTLIDQFEVARVEITPEIEALLTRLMAQPID